MISSAVACVEAGDHQALAELHSQCKYPEYKICLHMACNVALAQDLPRESVLQLYLKIATSKGNSAFSTWLHLVTANVVLMHLRRKALSLTPLEYAVPDVDEAHLGESFGTIDPCLAASIDWLRINRAASPSVRWLPKHLLSARRSEVSTSGTCLGSELHDWQLQVPIPQGTADAARRSGWTPGRTRAAPE